MLKRLWLVLSIGWAALMLIGQGNSSYQSADNWLGAFAAALAPFAVIPIARWIWKGRRNA